MLFRKTENNHPLRRAVMGAQANRVNLDVAVWTTQAHPPS